MTRILPPRPILPLTVVVVLCAVLLALAVLDYRWAGAVGTATGGRLRAELAESIRNLRVELRGKVFGTVDSRSSATTSPYPSWTVYARLYEQWFRTAEAPEIVTNVYAYNAGEEPPLSIVRFGPTTRDINRMQAPTCLRNLLRVLQWQVNPSADCMLWTLSDGGAILVKRVPDQVLSFRGFWCKFRV